MTLTFTGTAVSFIGEKGLDQGQIAWSIDGQAQTTVDTSAQARAAQQVLITSATLSPGSHTLQITKKSRVQP